MLEHQEHDEPLDPALRELARSYNAPPATPRDAMWERIQAARQAGQMPAGPVETVVIPFRRTSPRPAVRRVAWGAGIAALLAMGVAIGRVSVPTPAAVPVATETTDRAAPDPGAAPVDAPPTDAAPLELVSNDVVEPGAAPARRPRLRSAPQATPVSAERVTDDDQANGAFRMVAAQHLTQAETFLTLFRASVRSGRTEAIGAQTARQLLASNRLLLDSPASEDARTRRLLEDLELVLAQITQLPTDGTEADARLITDGMEAGDVLPRLRTAVPADLGVTLYQGAL